jgi:hypothetical protein
MTDLAYLLFTFMACLVGLGLGLVLHQIWTRAKLVAGTQDDPFAKADPDDETTSWEAYAKWQSDNNRRFATQVISCGAAPLVFASVAWSQRADVVHALCHNVIETVGQAYICM